MVKCPFCGNEAVRQPDLNHDYYECLNPFCQKKFKVDERV